MWANWGCTVVSFVLCGQVAREHEAGEHGASATRVCGLRPVGWGSGWCEAVTVGWLIGVARHVLLICRSPVANRSEGATPQRKLKTGKLYLGA